MHGLRSLLFVPGDRPDRFAKAAASGADAIILDLEDSVLPERKADARKAVAAYLDGPRIVPCVVRINPVRSAEAAADVVALRTARPDAVMLPKAEGAASVHEMEQLFGCPMPPLLPIATETPAAIFELGSYRSCSGLLAGLTWGAEDLPAAIGATSAREADGRYTPPYEMARSLTLLAAHAAGVPAIDTVYPDLADEGGLTAFVARARRDGFTGMLALHPRQVGVINAGFTPGTEEIAHAHAVVAAFEDHPQAGVLSLGGRMIDRPHLIQARRTLALLDSIGRSHK